MHGARRRADRRQWPGRLGVRTRDHRCTARVDDPDGRGRSSSLGTDSASTPRTWPKPSGSRRRPASQGPDAGVARPQLDISQVSREPAGEGGLPFIWPGLFTVGERAQLEGEDGLPVASMSSGIGGMGVYWTGSCPRPNGSERIPFIPDDEFEALYARAEAAPERAQEPAGRRRTAGRVARRGRGGVRRRRSRGHAGGVHADGELACRRPAAHVGHRGDPRPARSRIDRFEIRSDTLARRVLFDDGAAVGAELLDRISGAAYEVRARRVVVCADSLRTPQLLFASGVRPRALGHHLNDHFQMTAMVKLHDEFVRAMPAAGERTATGSVLIPFSPGRPMQGQVVALSRTGYVMPIGADSGAEPTRSARAARVVRREGHPVPRRGRVQRHRDATTTGCRR